MDKSVVIHVLTKKGKGYKFAEDDKIGYWHGVGPFDIETGKSLNTTSNELLKSGLAEIDKKRPELDRQVTEEVEIMVKYDGYIEMQKRQVEGFKKLEKKLLPEDLDYNTIKGIRLEARQKLNKYKPYSIGQASRISGVSPADISVLLIYLEQAKRNNK